MVLEVIDSGTNSAEVNMLRDQQLLNTLGPQPIFHMYDWAAPSATFGYFSNPWQTLTPQGVSDLQLCLAKRPTGGGIIFHQYDLAFSFLLPAEHPLFSINTLANYQLINTIVAGVIAPYVPFTPALEHEERQPQKSPQCAFCMAAVTLYDVSCGRKKIAGAAQRKTKRGLLHQGSICISVPPESFLAKIFVPDTSFASAMQTTSYPLFGHLPVREMAKAKEQLLRELVAAFRRKFS